MPRHPPCALNNKHKTDKPKQKTLTKHTNKKKKHSPPHTNKKPMCSSEDARVHYTVLTQHPHHTNNNPTTPTNQDSTTVITCNDAATRTTQQCCPRHPTACQHKLIFCSFTASHARTTRFPDCDNQALFTWRYVSTRFNNVGSNTSGHSTNYKKQASITA